MQFADYSPPMTPTLDQQRDALQKGLGRAMQWALAGRLEDEPLLEACLCDLRYDVQVEDSRGDWLWRLIQKKGAADRFRVPILHALYELKEERDANQLCELASYYAEAGDETFRIRLYEIIEEKPFPDRNWLGEAEIVWLDGEKGFLHAARVRGKQLAGRDWDWDDESLIEDACERFGEDRINKLLEDTQDDALKTYRQAWLREKQTKADRKPEVSYREQVQAIRVDEILEAAESRNIGYGRFRGWGMYADEADLEIIHQRLWAAREPTVVANLLKVFCNRRGIPRFDARIIEFCRHEDSEVRRWAFNVLEMTSHPLVRDFALAELEKGVRDRFVIGLFVNNYRQGDEQKILDAIELPDDVDELHWLLIAVIQMLDANEDADGSQLGLIVYALTPCQNCREQAARMLQQDRIAPAWLTEECCFDSNEEICQGVEEFRLRMPTESESL